jgi:hypothetical protein
MPDDALLSLARDRFKVAVEATTDQRQREIEDLQFARGEQWLEEHKRSRAGQQAGGGFPAVPARPCLTINKLGQPIDQLVNQQRSARLALSFAPKTDGASQDVAEAYEDIVRAIQADSRAHLARNWAFERAAQCGRGYYRILTDYANDGDDDLDIVYKRILNQATVYLDPFAQEPDWSDGEWAFITEDIPLDRYKRLYPDSKVALADDGELTSIGDDHAEWVGNGDAGVTIRVAEYFFIEHHEEKRGKRTVDRRVVQWRKINAVEVLDSEEWVGKFIPIVPVIGKEANINGERSWTGVIRPAMDAQRSYNVMRSAQVEAVGLAPRAPWLVTGKQIEGYEAWWNQANVRNLPYVLWNADSTPGAAPPQRNVAEPAIQAITLAAHEADADIKATTGIFDPSLGNMNPNDRSGKAILALQKQADISTSGYLDNLAGMSMIYEGKILRDLIPKVYDRPGRIVPGIGADDQRRSIMVNAPFVMQDKRPMAVPPGTPGAKTVDLTAGEYSVAVEVGKSWTTKREEAVAAMGELAHAAPQLVPMYADLWVKNMDGPGFIQIADRLKKSLPPQFQDSQNGQAPVPPQVQQQLQQSGQMIDALTQQLQEATKRNETDAAKQQATLAKAQIDAQLQIQLQTMRNAASIEIAKIGAATKGALASNAAENEAMALAMSHVHEWTMSQRAQQHEDAATEADRQHQDDQADAGRAHELTMAERQAQADREQQDRAAEQAAQADASGGGASA